MTLFVRAIFLTNGESEPPAMVDGSTGTARNAKSRTSGRRVTPVGTAIGRSQAAVLAGSERSVKGRRASELDAFSVGMAMVGMARLKDDREGRKVGHVNFRGSRADRRVGWKDVL